jgi:hypothetical protein
MPGVLKSFKIHAMAFGTSALAVKHSNHSAIDLILVLPGLAREKLRWCFGQLVYIQIFIINAQIHIVPIQHSQFFLSSLDNGIGKCSLRHDFTLCCVEKITTAIHE